MFDTGNDAAIFARNVKQLGVDLTRLDAIVISHRHGDHTTGLEVVVAANPGVPIYVPQEPAFFRGGARQFGDRFDQAGLGAVLQLPH